MNKKFSDINSEKEKEIFNNKQIIKTIIEDFENESNLLKNQNINLILEIEKTKNVVTFLNKNIEEININNDNLKKL